MDEYINNKLETSINVIGGLKTIDTAINVIQAYFLDNTSSTQNLTSAIHIKTEKSKNRIEHAIKTVFLQFINEEHCELFKSIFVEQNHKFNINLVLFWQFSLNNKLFYEISTKLLIKNYFSGRTTINKEEIIGFIKELIHQSKEKVDWSEITIETLATKYLSILSKLNIMSGKRDRCFNYISLTTEELVLFVYFAKLYNQTSSNFLNNPFIELSFIPKEGLGNRLKKLASKEYFNFASDGQSVNIEFKYNYKGIYSELFN